MVSRIGTNAEDLRIACVAASGERLSHGKSDDVRPNWLQRERE
jgi:hypothetical protein